MKNSSTDAQPTVLPGSKLGKAIAYALNHEETFKNVLVDGKLVLSNNHAERAIKTLVIGRKNWLFSQSFEGAQTSAIILSLIETAKRKTVGLFIMDKRSSGSM